MHLKTLILASTVGFAAASKPYTTKSCQTAFGTKSIKPVPTVSSTKRKTVTIRSTKCVQPTVTRTPKPITQTASTTVIITVSTTADPGVDTIEVVDTEYETSTLTLATTTFFETITQTVDTTVTSTSTIQAPASFQPIRDTLPGGTLRGSPDGSASQPVQRDAEAKELYERQAGSGSLLASRAKKGTGICPSKPAKQYPNKVNCVVVISVPKTIVVTKTKPAKTTTAAPVITTTTKTETVQSTSTIIPPNVTVITTSTTTSTIEATSTPSTTLTATSTTTNTVSLPGPTVHSMCQDDKNYADSINNAGYFINGFPSFSYGVSSFASTSARACCEACVAKAGCASSTFGFSTCVLVDTITTSCFNSPCSGSLQYSPTASNSYMFMNGPYMQWTSTR
ncbi:hypothetical protein B0J13DRAFT_569477 [Dactylonectria estremocensis]|uniref:Apple domain-containing protein n=1 Tax=Dactylonectria estremocensis TaxID=1079267 RepID=A0A9P9DGM1_9HYPO|nr:hypothetical protein B0J13DRAFT_569477 [Dactylonectria estremocensis]